MAAKLDLLLQSVEDVIGKSFDEIKGRKRNEEFVFARKTIVYYMQQDKYIDGLIANVVGLSRSNVSGMRATHDDDYRFNPKYRQIFDDITELYFEKLKQSCS
ncbi:MAG: hypothetical protein LBV72_00510 [Tannerella sp.]|nr:hypothetical protein [Tannerella sp.]